MEFKDGDLVMLRSGGPVMVVSDCDSTPGLVTCQWCYGGIYESRQFLEIVLSKVEGKKSEAKT